MVGRGRDAVEVAKTVLEVAEAAWTALEHHHHQHDREAVVSGSGSSLDEELASLKSENRRLRNLLEQNLKLLQNLSLSPSLVNDCPPDVSSTSSTIFILISCLVFYLNDIANGETKRSRTKGL